MGKYTTLMAYRCAAALADGLRAEVDGWSSIDQWTLGVQMVKAADSVGANIAEAYGRGTPRDEQRFLLYARGSAHETQHWIERALAHSLLTGEAYRSDAARVGQLVNGLMRAQRRQFRMANGE